MLAHRLRRWPNIDPFGKIPREVNNWMPTSIVNGFTVLAINTLSHSYVCLLSINLFLFVGTVNTDGNKRILRCIFSAYP